MSPLRAELAELFAIQQSSAQARFTATTTMFLSEHSIKEKLKDAMLYIDFWKIFHINDKIF